MMIYGAWSDSILLFHGLLACQLPQVQSRASKILAVILRMLFGGDTLFRGTSSECALLRTFAVIEEARGYYTEDLSNASDSKISLKRASYVVILFEERILTLLPFLNFIGVYGFRVALTIRNNPKILHQSPSLAQHSFILYISLKKNAGNQA